jgi:phosphoribosylanthranilate isomerase
MRREARVDRGENVGRVRVKICGITSVEDALAACEAGADAIGLNFIESSPRYVGHALAAILGALPPFVQVVGVLADADPMLVDTVRGDVDMLQFHGNEDARRTQSLFLSPLLRAIRVRSADDLLQIPKWDAARAILLDGAGRPGTHGGATFDWSLVAVARTLTRKPLIIAGGLTPENVGEAIRATRPAAVDVASGVESAPGKKDPAKVRAFVAAVHAAAGE